MIDAVTSYTGALPFIYMTTETIRLKFGFTEPVESELPEKAQAVRLVCTADCLVRFGVDPVAEQGGFLLLARIPEVFGWEPGHKISVVSFSDHGELFITPVSHV